MMFLIDAQLPRSLVQWLKDAGYGGRGLTLGYIPCTHFVGLPGRQPQWCCVIFNVVTDTAVNLPQGMSTAFYGFALANSNRADTAEDCCRFLRVFETCG